MCPSQGDALAYMEGHISPLLLRVPSGLTMQEPELSAATQQHRDGAWWREQKAKQNLRWL